MMSFEQFCGLVSAYTHTPASEITESASFRDQLMIDSLQMVNMLVCLTGEMQIGMDALSGPEDLSTVGSLYHALMKEVGK